MSALGALGRFAISSIHPRALRGRDQVELDLVAVELDALGDLKCSSDPLVIVQSDDHAPNHLKRNQSKEIGRITQSRSRKSKKQMPLPI